MAQKSSVGVFRGVYTDLPITTAYTLPILRGVLRYAATVRHWELNAEQLSSVLRQPRRGNRYDGHILTGVSAKEAVARGVEEPIVCVSDRPEWFSGPMVIPDNVATGEMAADHLLEMGLRRFAMVGPMGTGVARHRYEGFARRVERTGADVITLPPAEDPEASLFSAPREWLEALPRPCGVLCWNDATARNVILDARELGLAVPDDLAVFGVYNDDLLSESVRLGISSVALPLEKVGFEAAALLDRLMAGEAAPAEPMRLPPVEVVQRGSTQTVVLEDREVARALAMIREHAAEGLTVEEICEALDLSVSRRTFERRFTAHLGRSPHEEIRRTQCQLARRLLAKTDLPQSQIAVRCGFSSTPFFSTSFRRMTGSRPGEYRKAARAG